MYKTENDSSAIEHILEQSTEAWNRGDAEAFSCHMAEDVSFTNILGMYFIGRSIFCKRHQLMLEGPFKGTTMECQLISTKWLQPGVAVVDAFVRVLGCRAGTLSGIYISKEGMLCTRLLQVMVKHTEGWQVAAYHNIDIKAGVLIPELE